MTTSIASISIDQLSIDTLRLLAVDGVEKAKSGHPGAALGCAPIAYLLFQNLMKHNPQVVLIATGSEVSLALGAAKLLAADGIKARVVSMPSWKLFEEQSAEYMLSVLPAGVPKLAVEAGAPQGWWRYVGSDGDVVGLARFGASAPGKIVMAELGFTPENVAARAKKIVKQ